MYWDNGWHHRYVGPGWLLVMAVMMLVFWGGLAWLLVTVIRKGGPVRHDHAAGSDATPLAGRPDPEQILHERLAHGEIDIDEYQQRIDALRARRSPPP